VTRKLKIAKAPPNGLAVSPHALAGSFAGACSRKIFVRISARFCRQNRRRLGRKDKTIQNPSDSVGGVNGAEKAPARRQGAHTRTSTEDTLLRSSAHAYLRGRQLDFCRIPFCGKRSASQPNSKEKSPGLQRPSDTGCSLPHFGKCKCQPIHILLRTVERCQHLHNKKVSQVG
jgi:hypothetical protein